MGWFRSWHISIACVSALSFWAAPVRAADCGPGDVTVSAANANVGAYNPFGPAPSKIVVISISTHSQSEGACDLALSFGDTASPSMRGVSTARLSYTIEAVGGGTTYVSAGAFPPHANRIDFSLPATGGFASQNIQVRVFGDQIVGDGLYVDNTSGLNVFNRHAGGLTLIKSIPFPVSAVVTKACQLPPPSVAMLNFTSTIRNGQPNPNHGLTTTFSNVNCTAPTTVRLHGDAMRLAASVAAPGGFDNFINWRASAIFGGASAVLSTVSASEAVSTSRNVTAGPTANGSIELEISLVMGRPLIAGAYSGILTISLDPDL